MKISAEILGGLFLFSCLKLSKGEEKILPPVWATNAVKTLTTNMLHDTYYQEGIIYNAVLSPIGVWTILAMLQQAAEGDTEKELRTALGIPDSVPSVEVQQTMRLGYVRLKELLPIDGDATDFSSINFLVSDKNKKIDTEYDEVIRSLFEGKHFEVDFNDTESTKEMNDWVQKATKDRIISLVVPSEMKDFEFLMGNTAFFQGKWKYPFNYTETYKAPFKSDTDQQYVTMMKQRVILPYAYNEKLESQMVEIPYADGHTSMIVILPKKKVKVIDVLKKMKNLNIEEIIPENLHENEVQLQLPKLSVSSNMYLNKMLSQYVPNTFKPSYAELPKISKEPITWKVAQRAAIEIHEAGFPAPPVTNAQLANKATSVRFQANRPFIYLINDIKSRTILYAGYIISPFP